ncbi:hypothetical protein BDV95DRAFT_490003 [Massariosphaeria phaeospora]|uniref:Protein fem-1 homolog B n=1 Tax=Massariosphaeria phaeospora TaxID=100035 RepID=A0A7C8MR99_9PLEO|nr:hypothetical protein BDV95DRAFT_490003 [Massariosphaeria phaeospora]
MASFTLLPDELLLAILTQAACVRSIKRALRLRLVSKRFANIATTAIFNSGILDCEEIFSYIYRGPIFWAEYLAYRTLMHTRQKSPYMKITLLVAQHICRYRNASADETCVATGAATDGQLRECVLGLCIMFTLRLEMASSRLSWMLVASTDAPEEEVDEASLEFKRYLLSAAAWIGEKSLVVKLVGEGCNYADEPGIMMCLAPLRAASYRGHVDIVKFLMVDDSGEAPDLRKRPNLIVTYAMLNDHTELLDLAMDPSWHRGELMPEDYHDLRILALSSASNLETFIRLFEDMKPDITKYESIWLPSGAAEQGHATILKYLIDKEGTEVNADFSNNMSLFQSRCPAKFRTNLFGITDYTLLGRAARAGHMNVVKILLDAGAKHGHAMQFAAMSGSRTLVRLLWEHGENKDDPVQGAFATAVDRENTAMFYLLEEMGAKLEDDVRAAMIQKAQEEGLESMVRLLSKDANVSSEGDVD